MNVIACENSKTGTDPSVWDISGAGDEGIQGFATDMSVNVGGQIRFKIKTTASAYTIDIYRLGYYGGKGARKITSVTPSATLPQIQPGCVTDPATEIYDCGSWGVSASWVVPSNQVSGVYIAKLTVPSNGDTSHIPFVVRNDASTSKIFFKTSDATWQAYNNYGGSEFYHGGPNGRAFKVSYNRPFATRGVVDGRDYLFSNEYPMIRFLEQNGYDVSYTTDVDGDRNGALVANHDIFLSVGHDEYWSGPQRAAVEAARDTGTNLAFFSGNSVYWRTRWETSKDGANTPHRTLVCYKETWNNTDQLDPTTEFTGTWRDPRFPNSTGGGKPENALMGTMFKSNSVDLALAVPADQGKYRLWRNSPVATRAASNLGTTLAPHTLGYEADEDVDNGFRPEGLIRVSTATGPVSEYLTDFGNTVITDATTTHNLTLYRAPSGALVFGAGTVQWAWGLDQNHDGFLSEPQAPDQSIQQATINLFADMGVQPTTLMAGMQPAGQSTDVTPPTVTISSPGTNTTLANGTQVTVSGTAADTGGRVAGVEVSTDGATWHPATGTTSWSYTYNAVGDGSHTVRVRAIDDSANIGNTATRAVGLTGATSIFGNKVPATPSVTDTSAVELGTKFTSTTDGYVQGVRFYKGSGNTGTHNAKLWSANGSLLASGVFSNETATGWQTMSFAQPVQIQAGNTYVVSYTAPNGRYAADRWFTIYKGYESPPLSMLSNKDAGGNGVYGNPGTFPTGSYQAANYYVDVLFTSSGATPPVVNGQVPANNAKYVQPTIQPQATFSKAINTATLTFTLKNAGNVNVPGTTTYNATTRTATFTPSSALAAGQTYTATVNATDATGLPMATPKVWSFSTDPGNTTVVKMFADDAVPATAEANDSSSVTLGMKWSPTENGTVIGVRFYKGGTGNGGVHTGSLWNSDGTQRLATATFAAESASGWQTVYFDSPVTVTAGQTYVATYFAPIGRYSVNGNYFTSTQVNGPLTATSVNNGVYLYGSDGFPTASWNRSNYWVDPLFVADPPPPPPTFPAGAVTVWPDTTVPANANWNDNAAIEVGVKFTTNTAGKAYGVRFYKGPTNTGAHTGTLWDTAGNPIASGNFVGESASGWQLMLFAAPVTLTPGTTYIVSYSTTVGRYAVNVNGFQSAGVTSGPLSIPQGGAVYKYGVGFPNNTSNHNFWVDPVFKPGA
ncbi:DUF4082 domain-containing protein [Virgisporangium aliadipatigenens]|uniref:DUF4082 domain-containing protein n=1 Tax=Virgisporangium aliadipatigenens TaxID=741659 RepID=UPI001944EBB9|nr:DUF4082 domain-containing protein [Virgisporangium aliadipatigenens]